MKRTIALLTDFGLKDVYVGAMKGVIASINPELKVIDLTHQIPPQNIIAARFALMSTVPYFPHGTIHLAVVDPGVGGNRRGVAIAFERGWLVGPDNGIFSGVLSLYPPRQAVGLTNSDYWLNANPSKTFHGRDIFAPAASHLASGVPLANLGEEIDLNTLQAANIPKYEQWEREIVGQIQYIDIFGNLITNIPSKALAGKDWSVLVNNSKILPGETYSSVGEGKLVALIGSDGWLEIAVNGGSAREVLQQTWGNEIKVKWLY